MKFPVLQLDNMNHRKPFVQLGDMDEWIQWDTCDLEGLPTEMIGVSMNSHGKIPKGQWDNLPEKFTAIGGKEYKIEDIHSLKSS
jgi:hypothetical protein|tara:strand:+ start:217 stop:468 length:252 start_codon:yes stop_codon:yes gene_type:complete